MAWGFDVVWNAIATLWEMHFSFFPPLECNNMKHRGIYLVTEYSILKLVNTLKSDFTDKILYCFAAVKKKKKIIYILKNLFIIQYM